MSLDLRTIEHNCREMAVRGRNRALIEEYRQAATAITNGHLIWHPGMPTTPPSTDLLLANQRTRARQLQDVAVNRQLRRQQDARERLERQFGRRGPR